MAFWRSNNDNKSFWIGKHLLSPVRWRNWTKERLLSNDGSSPISNEVSSVGQCPEPWPSPPVGHSSELHTPSAPGPVACRRSPSDAGAVVYSCSAGNIPSALSALRRTVGWVHDPAHHRCPDICRDRPWKGPSQRSPVVDSFGFHIWPDLGLPGSWKGEVGRGLEEDSTGNRKEFSSRFRGSEWSKNWITYFSLADETETKASRQTRLRTISLFILSIFGLRGGWEVVSKKKIGSRAKSFSGIKRFWL